MPQVEPTELTSEESQKQLDAQESMKTEAMDRIKGGDVFKSLDLPESEQETEQAEEEQSEEQEVQAEGDDTGDDSFDEEVVPKSKIQPRIDQLTSQIKQLEQRLLDKETAAPKDDVQEKLESMDENELEDTLTQVRLAKEKSRDDDEALLKLVKLERQIEKTIVKAPQIMQQKQVTEFNRAANRLIADGSLSDANYSKVVEIAKGIYQQYPKLQKSTDGQAMALELASNHYKEVSKLSSGKPNVQNLKAQVNNLKRRTSLDTKSIKSGGNKLSLDKLRDTAMTGTMKDKEKFAHNDPRFKIDAMIPDHLKG
jgi:phage terminase small subunit